MRTVWSKWCSRFIAGGSRYVLWLHWECWVSETSTSRVSLLQACGLSVTRCVRNTSMTFSHSYGMEVWTWRLLSETVALRWSWIRSTHVTLDPLFQLESLPPSSPRESCFYGARRGVCALHIAYQFTNHSTNTVHKICTEDEEWSWYTDGVRVRRHRLSRILRGYAGLYASHAYSAAASRIPCVPTIQRLGTERISRLVKKNSVVSSNILILTRTVII